MAETLSPAELLHLRLHAQLLSDDPPRADGQAGPDRIAEVARHMLALQGQEWRSSRWALGVRAPGTTDHDVLRAFDEGKIVRAWPMRGTLHVVPAEDIGWMQRAANHRVLPGAARRREYLGLAETTLDRLMQVTIEALTGGRSLDRNEAAELWSEAGIQWQSNWRYHVLWWMCQNGITAFGPVTASETTAPASAAPTPATTGPRLVLADEWIPRSRDIEGDEALAELAARYTTARGAVTAKDLAWWSGLTVREARQALALATEVGRLTQVAVADAEPLSAPAASTRASLWASPAMLDAALASSAPLAPDWLLLPAFDEHLLGYTERSAQLDPAHFEHIVPGKNGIFLATVVHEGRVVGTWKRGARKAEPIAVTPLPGRAVDEAALAGPTSAWQRFQAAGPRL